MSTTTKSSMSTVSPRLDEAGERSLQVDGPRLLDAYNAFVDKIKRRRTPGLHLNMQLSADLGLDSLNRVELMIHMEESFKAPIDPDRSASVQTLNDLLRLINEKRESSLDARYAGLSVSDLLHHLIKEVPQFYNEVDEQSGRTLKIKGKVVYDFASANYLGLDLDERIFKQIELDLRKWGTHPSWSARR